MKKKIISILTLAAVAIGCFFIGRNTADQPKMETHVDRMEYTLENISYWEFGEDGETNAFSQCIQRGKEADYRRINKPI